VHGAPALHTGMLDVLNLMMANLNKFLNQAKEMLSETKEKKGGGEVKNQQYGHSFALQFSVIYATIGKHAKLCTRPLPPPPLACDTIDRAKVMHSY
jgi:hypothetical protein